MGADRPADNQTVCEMPTHAESDAAPKVDWDGIDAFLFDLDGVVTQTARIHASAWKKAFDEYLRERMAHRGGDFHPFDLEKDYKTYVDGKPRFNGVASFLQSRDIWLPHGSETDPPDKETICGLGNRKNRFYLHLLRERGVDVYSSSVSFIRQLRSTGRKVAVVTASRNCDAVLEAGGIADLFDARVDGIVAREWLLDGKPAPDTYLEAAHRLGVSPARACVIEDALAGVEAGKAGNFALVIGVARDGDASMLRQCGADIVVSDLSELDAAVGPAKTSEAAPLALDHLREIEARLRHRRVVVFLDYDGTLTPIVDRPEDAVMSEKMRTAVRDLSGVCPVVIISGRALMDIQNMVALDEVMYAGSHGFDIAARDGSRTAHHEGGAYVPALAAAAQDLRDRLSSIGGVLVENKTYTVAVHYRLVDATDIPTVEGVVDDVLEAQKSLRKAVGKKVFELRPNIDWDKGKAVLWLLHALELDGPEVVPVYLGDDVTDQDAFEALGNRGLCVLVAEDALTTSADFRLANPEEVRFFLRQLTVLLEEGEP